MPDCLDEQPSKRGVYPHEVPMVYIRSAEAISLEDNVSLRIDGSMKPYIREAVISEQVFLK